MREQHMFDVAEWNAGENELSRDTISTIDDIHGVITDDGLCRCRARLPGTWPTRRAEQDETRSRALSTARGAGRVAATTPLPRGRNGVDALLGRRA